jgi:hypothetical protein
MHFYYKRIVSLFIVFFFFALPLLSGQERTARKAERKKELFEKLERKYYQKARKKTIKHRREMQTKTTQKRMKDADRKARDFNSQKKKNWLEEKFCRKKPRK